jgi:hypothetical protein
MSSSSVLRKEVKLFVLAAFAVVSTHSSFKEGVTSGRRPVVKIIAESLSHDKKYVVPTSLRIRKTKT